MWFRKWPPKLGWESFGPWFWSKENVHPSFVTLRLALNTCWLDLLGDSPKLNNCIIRMWGFHGIHYPNLFCFFLERGLYCRAETGTNKTQQGKKQSKQGQPTCGPHPKANLPKTCPGWRLSNTNTTQESKIPFVLGFVLNSQLVSRFCEKSFSTKYFQKPGSLTFEFLRKQKW